MKNKLASLGRAFRKRLSQLMLDYDFEVFEAFNGLVAMLWGGVLLLPVSSFASGTSYSNMALLAPEWVWGLVLLVFGVAQVWALLLGVRSVRRNVALAMFSVWIFLSVSLASSGQVTTALAVYPSLAFFSFGNYFHITFR